MSSLLDIFSPRLTMLIQLALIFGFFYSNLILAQESSLLNVVFGQDKSSFQIFVNGTYYFYQFFLYIVLAVRQYTAFDMFFLHYFQANHGFLKTKNQAKFSLPPILKHFQIEMEVQLRLARKSQTVLTSWEISTAPKSNGILPKWDLLPN